MTRAVCEYNGSGSGNVQLDIRLGLGGRTRSPPTGERPGGEKEGKVAAFLLLLLLKVPS